MSQPKTINILEIFKDFFACKNVLAKNHHYPEKIQRLFRLPNCLSRKSSLSWKYSKTFSPAKLSLPQMIFILKTFKEFLACKIVLAANHHCPGNIQRFFRLQNCFDATHHYPENIQKLFACKIVLAAKHHYPEIFQRLFRLQYCHSRKPSLCWKYSKTFSPANCLRCKSSLSWKYSKSFLPAKMS